MRLARSSSSSRAAKATPSVPGAEQRYATRFCFAAVVAGHDTDTSRDYEYTDWEAVDRFAREFAADFAPAR